MLLLIAGLVLFFGVHSARVFADGFRADFIAARGEKTWKGIYAILSIAGFVLLVYGYGEARTAPIVLWTPPVWTRHAAALLTLPAFVLLAAAYVPRNAIKSRLGHPMLLGTQTLGRRAPAGERQCRRCPPVWRIPGLGDPVLPGGEEAATAPPAPRYPSGGAVPTAVSVAIGAGAWAAFAFHLHAAWIGVPSVRLIRRARARGRATSAAAPAENAYGSAYESLGDARPPVSPASMCARASNAATMLTAIGNTSIWITGIRKR
jgi:hypothetical protein